MNLNTDVSILWRRLDKPGHESARLYLRDSCWHLTGTAVFAHDGVPCRLDYKVVCDSEWRTVSAAVDGWVGTEDVRYIITAGPNHYWKLNGDEVPGVQGSIDIDLGFSPSTNLLPIRRLNLDVGQSAEVAAAWLQFPSFKMESLDQVYRRDSERTCHYSSRGGTFAVELEINSEGLVTRYPGFFELETGV